MKHLPLILLCSAATAAAQPAPKTAEQHYEQSKRYYDVEKYDEAIAELKTAYTLSADPVYLFNIAQAMRKKGDCAGAIDYYRKYLRESPSAPNKAKVEQWMAELDACAKTQPRIVDPKPVDPKPVDAKPVDPKPIDAKPVDAKPVDAKPIDTRPIEPIDQPPRDSKRTLRIAGLATAGVGVGLLVVGTAFAFNASGISSDVASDCNDADGCNWIERSKDDDRGRSRATLSRIMFGVGGAALIGGGVMYVLGRSPKRERMAIVPSGDGALVTFGGRY